MNTERGFCFFLLLEIMEDGFKKYTRNLWNVVDFAQVSAYLASAALRMVVYFGKDLNVTSPAEMSSSDPLLVADSFFAGWNSYYMHAPHSLRPQ